MKPKGLNKVDEKTLPIGVGIISEDEAKFLKMAKGPTSRVDLLARLEKLGLLSAFLAAENGTTQ